MGVIELTWNIKLVSFKADVQTHKVHTVNYGLILFCFTLKAHKLTQEWRTKVFLNLLNSFCPIWKWKVMSRMKQLRGPHPSTSQLSAHPGGLPGPGPTYSGGTPRVKCHLIKKAAAANIQALREPGPPPEEDQPAWEGGRLPPTQGSPDLYQNPLLCGPLPGSKSMLILELPRWLRW